MKYCGIDLKGNEAIIVSIEILENGYQLIEPDVKKIKLKDADVQGDVQTFAKEIYAFLDKMAFDKIAIKGRAKKGKFAGGPVSFKIEGIIQCGLTPVTIFAGATIKAKLKNTEVDTSGINAYQVDALRAALCL